MANCHLHLCNLFVLMSELVPSTRERLMARMSAFAWDIFRTTHYVILFMVSTVSYHYPSICQLSPRHPAPPSAMVGDVGGSGVSMFDCGSMSVSRDPK